MKHLKLSTINMKNHSEVNESWLQDVISKDPSLLGLGDIVLKDKERIQPRAGRLDLLFQDLDGPGRYEVEIQLGATDESHIIRTIEYWDIEKKRYPQYEHTAVIIAEDITSRFLNVISLFNGFIPIMALKVTAFKLEDGIGLQFTKILDTTRLGYLDDDEETMEIVDRSYWESRGTKKTVKLADKILDIIKEFAPDVELSYNKHYLGLWLNGKAANFAIFRPQKKALRLEVHLPQTEETEELINDSELVLFDYNKRWGRYRLNIYENEIDKNRETLKTILKSAYNYRF